MPKKYKQFYNSSSTANSYVHPSLGSSKPATAPSTAPGAVATVNERLQQLRKEQASQEAAKKQLEAAATSISPSVPPELRSVLGVPDSIPLRPKPGLSRLRLRTPGPAPPRSWLISRPNDHGRLSRGQYGAAASRGPRSYGGHIGSYRPRPAAVLEFATCAGTKTISPRTLTHSVIRKISENWSCIDHDGLAFLAACPEHIVTALPSFVALYGPEDGLTAHDLEQLLRHVRSQNILLDLTALVGWCLSLRELSALLVRRSKRDVIDRSQGTTSVADVWDAEADDHVVSLNAQHGTPKGLPLVITKLSLALPPVDVSWTDLLALSARLPRLTHLSLAYWPPPQKGIHGIATTSNGPSISRSAITDLATLRDPEEARLILRQLSKQTYCLEYLDLSGCAWTEALIPDQRSGPNTTTPRSASSTWSSDRDAQSGTTPDLPSSTGADWHGAWSQLSFLRLAQVTQPHHLAHVPSYTFTKAHPGNATSAAASFVRRDLIAFLHRQHPMSRPNPGQKGTDRHMPSVVMDWRSEEYRDKKCKACGFVLGTGDDCAGCAAWTEHCKVMLDAWIAREMELRDVARRIKQVRRTCMVDLGWMVL